MFQSTYQKYKIAEGLGHIPKGSAFRLTMATCMEGAAALFHQSYWGHAEWAKAQESVNSKEHHTEQIVGLLTEAALSEFSTTQAAFREAHTTTDLPAILNTLRNRVIRTNYQPGDSMLVAFARQRPVSNFRSIEGVTVGGFADLKELPEGTDITYGTYESGKDSFRASMYAKGFKFTYQMWKNDDFGLVQTVMTEAGIAAQRTRYNIIADALVAGLTRVTPATTGVGGPTIERLEEIINLRAAFTEVVAKETRPRPRPTTDLILPYKWQTQAATTLNSQELNRTGDKSPTANPVYKAATPHIDQIWSEKGDADWIAYNRNEAVVELAVLDDFAGGPMMRTRLPNVVESDPFGSFENMTFAMAWADACGSATVPNANKAATRVAGK